MYHATMPTDALLQVRAALFATRDFGFEKVREERFGGGMRGCSVSILPCASASTAARLTRAAGQARTAGAGAQGEEDSGEQGHCQRCRAGISGATSPVSKPFLFCFGFCFGGFVGATAGRLACSTTSGAKRGCELHRKP
jgi:hypothetical protein